MHRLYESVCPMVEEATRAEEDPEETRVVLRKKVYVQQTMTLVDRPSTHSLTNPRAVERYLEAMTLTTR